MKNQNKSPKDNNNGQTLQTFILTHTHKHKYNNTGGVKEMVYN